MTLSVFTARISSRDPDRLDITRKSGGPIGSRFAPSAGLLSAAKSGRLTFGEYEPLYIAEMRESYRWNRGEWEDLLARPRLVACCYCVHPDECHRSLFAAILCKLGADVGGEVGLSAAVAAVETARASGHLSPRDVVTACDAAGAELCVVWTVLNRSGVIRESYESAKARGLLAAVREVRRSSSGLLPAGGARASSTGEERRARAASR